MAYITSGGDTYQPGEDVEDPEPDEPETAPSATGAPTAGDDAGATVTSYAGDTDDTGGGGDGGTQDSDVSVPRDVQRDQEGTPLGYLRVVDQLRGIDTGVGDVPVTGDTDRSVGVTESSQPSETQESSGSSGALDVSIETVTTTEPGRIQIDGTVSGTLGVSFRDVGGGPNTIDVSFTPEVNADRYGTQVASNVQDRIQEARNIVQTYPSGLAANAGDVVPDRLQNINSVALPLEVEFLQQADEVPVLGQFAQGNTIKGRSPVEFSKTIEFEPVDIPTYTDAPSIVDNMEPFQIRARVTPKGAVQSAYGVIEDHPTAIIEIPPDVFINEVPLSNFECESLFDQTDENIDRVRGAVAAANNFIRSQINTLTNIRDEFRTAQNELSRLAQDPSAELESNLRGRLEEFKDRVNDVSTKPFESSGEINNFSSLSEARTFIEEQRTTVTEDIARVGACSSQFIGRINNVETQLQTLEDRIESLAATRDNLLQDIRETGLPPCTERFTSLDNQITELENTVGAGGGQPDFETPIGIRQRRDLIGQIDNTISQVEEQVGSESSCMAEFRSRLQSAKSRLRRFNVDWECGQRYSSINNELNQLENLVGVGDSVPQLGTPVEASRITTVGQRIGDLSSEIESQVPDDEPCKGNFEQRLQAVANSVTELPVQDVQDFDPDNLEDVQAELPPELANTLTQLQSTIENLRQRLEQREEQEPPTPPTDGEVELPEGGLIGPGASTCADAPRGIRNEVVMYREDVESYLGKNMSERSQQRKDELLNEAGSLRERVLDRVSSDNACQEELLARLDRFEAEVRPAETRTQEQIPCSQRYPDIAQQVRNFEQTVLGLRLPIPPGQMSQVVEQGETLIQNIEEDIQDGGSCEQAFVGSVDSALERLSQFEQRISIIRGGGAVEEARQQRRQRVEELRDQLEEIGEDSG